VAQVLTPLAHPETHFSSLSQITLVQKNKQFFPPQQHIASTLKLAWRYKYVYEMT
jgi:hypothetical protein